tara:strand:- start:569 stop:1729 length:1161 start_codon:yes stop_codon:yes gene_type:complete
MSFKDRIKELIRVPAGDLLPNPKNWRQHPEKQRSALSGVLSEVGWADAVLARETADGLMLIDGHLRTEVAPDAEIPVLVLDVSEDEADKILLTHDPLADMAETNAAALDSLMRDVNTGSEGVQEMLAELADSAGLYPDDAKEIVEDEVPEPPKKAVVKEGEIWQLGSHRLMCGDCSKEHTISMLLDGAKPSLLLTDPPYGIQMDKGFGGFGGFGKPIARRVYDDEWDASRPSVETFRNIIKAADLSLIFGGNYFADLLPISTHWLVWDKQNTMPTFSDCELVWTNSDRKSVMMYRHTYNGLIGKERSRFHPTQKPVALFVQLLTDYCNSGTIVLDPFLGSGTTLIAAEQLGRECYGMEISPHYCDVIIERWQNLTGQKAKKVKDGT